MLQILFFMATLFMNKGLEPEELELQVPRENHQQEGDVEESALLELNDEIPQRQMTTYEKFCLNIKLIGDTLKHKKIMNALTFFFITGMMLPQFEDIQFYFLLNKCGISQAEYDMMNIFQSIGILTGIIVYMAKLTKTEVWKLIFASLIFQFLEAAL